MKKTRILACLEFTKSVIEFCERSSYREITETAYKAFLAQEPGLPYIKAVLLDQMPHERSTLREEVVL
jgi:hypothetical protein